MDRSEYMRRGGYSLVALLTVGFIVLQLVGLGYASKFVFGTSTEKNGKMCYQLTMTQIKLIRMVSILLWAGVAYQLYLLYQATCISTSSVLGCGAISIRYGAVVLLLLEIVGLGILSRFAFNAVEDAGDMCAPLSTNDVNLLRVSLLIIWFSLGLMSYKMYQKMSSSGSVPRLL